jgi:hypothetical protein
VHERNGQESPRVVVRVECQPMRDEWLQHPGRQCPGKHEAVAKVTAHRNWMPLERLPRSIEQIRSVRVTYVHGVGTARRLTEPAHRQGAGRRGHESAPLEVRQ